MLTPPHDHDISRETLLEIFKKMALIRLCDERLISTIRSGQIAAQHYSPRGQEAISSAIAVNLRPDDYMLTIYRGLHDHLAKGTPLKALWAEYAGRTTGSCGGKGGAMHITHPAAGVMVTTGIVGSGIPIANGFAWASKLDDNKKVTITNFGDGASNIGAFHEGLNLASVWQLPVVFVCHNNLFGEHTAYALATAIDRVADRAASYNMPGIHVNGNDPVAMWAAAREAIDRARSGGGPTLIEAMTFRFNGHNLGDPGEYIDKALYADQLTKDPVPLYRASLLEWGTATEAELKAIEDAINADIDEAVEFALNSPWPEGPEIYDDVYDVPNKELSL